MSAATIQLVGRLPLPLLHLSWTSTAQVQLTAVDRGSAREKALDAAIKSVLNKRQAGRSQPGPPPVSQVEVEEFDVQPGSGRAADFDPDRIAVELRDRCDSAYRPNVVPLSTMSPISDRHSCEQTSQVRPQPSPVHPSAIMLHTTP